MTGRAKARLPLALLAVTALAGCSQCGKGGSGKAVAAAEELVPPGQASVVTGPLGAAGDHAGALLARLAQLPGAEPLTDIRRSFSARLGFDPFTREGLVGAGIDPDRGAALTLAPQGAAGTRWVAAFPLTKPELFVQSVEKLAQERLALPERAETPREGLRIVSFQRGGAPEQGLAVAVVRGYGVLALGSDAVGAVAAAGARKKDAALSTAPLLVAARETLNGSDAMLLAPAGSDALAWALGGPLPGAGAVGFTASGQNLTARFFLDLPAEQAKEFAALLPGGGAPLLELLPGAAFLRARLGVAPAQVPAQLARVPALREPLAQLRAAAAAKRVDLDRDVFGALQPGLVFSVGLAPTLDLARAIDAGIDFRRASPFDTLQIVAIAPVADKARLVGSFGALADAISQIAGAQLRAARTGDEVAVSLPAGSGARFGVRSVEGHDLAYLVAGGIAPEALARKGGGGPGLAAGSALTGAAGAALLLDLQVLSDALSHLPEQAYGAGPQAYVTRSLVQQVAVPLRPLRITGSLQPGLRGPNGELRIDIAAAEPAAGKPATP